VIFSPCMRDVMVEPICFQYEVLSPVICRQQK
jgi:hypothetical protein